MEEKKTKKCIQKKRSLECCYHTFKHCLNMKSIYLQNKNNTWMLWQLLEFSYKNHHQYMKTTLQYTYYIVLCLIKGTKGNNSPYRKQSDYKLYN